MGREPQAFASAQVPPVLAAALIGPEDKALPETLPPPPEISFRAAALAVVRLTGLWDYSFVWNTGRLFWLPRPKKKSAA
jgi:hypothetical protein